MKVLATALLVAASFQFMSQLTNAASMEYTMVDDNSTVVDSLLNPCGHPTWIPANRRILTGFGGTLGQVGGQALCSSDCRTCYFFYSWDTAGAEPFQCKYIEGQGYPGTNGDCPVKVCCPLLNAGWCNANANMRIDHCRVERDR